METPKKSWGGARTGAGRKADPQGKRVTIGATVSPKTAETLKNRAKEMGLSLGAYLDYLAQSNT